MSLIRIRTTLSPRVVDQHRRLGGIGGWIYKPALSLVIDSCLSCYCRVYSLCFYRLVFYPSCVSRLSDDGKFQILASRLGCVTGLGVYTIFTHYKRPPSMATRLYQSRAIPGALESSACSSYLIALFCSHLYFARSCFPLSLTLVQSAQAPTPLSMAAVLPTLHLIRDRHHCH